MWDDYYAPQCRRPVICEMIYYPNMSLSESNGSRCCDQSQSSVSQHEELTARLYSCLASSPASPSPRSNFGCRVTASNQSTIAESNIHISCLFYVVMIMYSSRIVLGCPTIYPRINVSLRRILLSLLLTLCWVISITT